MLKINKKNIFIFIVILFLFFVFLFYFKKYNKKEEYKLDLDFKYNGNIFVSTKLPISDKLGKSIIKSDDMASYIEFSINNPYDKKLKYDLYISSKKVNNPVESSYVKFYFTDIKNSPCKGFEKNIIPSYVDLMSLDDDSNKLLYRGFINSKSTEKYILRVWISDTYPFSNDLKFFESSINVVVR